MNVLDLQWKKFPVLDDGFVCLVDVMGDDASVVQAARVSYGKDVRYFEQIPPEEQQKIAKELDIDLKSLDDKSGQWAGPSGEIDIKQRIFDRFAEIRGKNDRSLIRYLMRHRHTTPFEMAEIKLLVRVPMDCWRQWIRHRTANVNEYSTRYSVAIDSTQKTAPDKWRYQARDNKQGSAEYMPIHVDGRVIDTEGRVIGGGRLTKRESQLHDISNQVYQERIDAGVAREQARKDLPLSTYTEAYWKIDLHNMLHFLGLRMDSHAQSEIRDYANTIGYKIIKPLFPSTWEAFEDYRLNALFLTKLDIEVIAAINKRPNTVGLQRKELNSNLSDLLPEEWRNKERCREREGCFDKLERLGIIS